MSSELDPILMHFKVPISYSWDYKAGEEVLFRRRRKTIPIHILSPCLFGPDQSWSTQWSRIAVWNSTRKKRKFNVKHDWFVHFMSLFCFVPMYFVYVVKLNIRKNAISGYLFCLNDKILYWKYISGPSMSFQFDFFLIFYPDFIQTLSR